MHSMIGVATVLALLFVGGAMVCAAEAPPQPHGGRLQFVRALIEESSAARRIDSSSNTAAKARREQARELHRSRGDLEALNKNLERLASAAQLETSRCCLAALHRHQRHGKGRRWNWLPRCHAAAGLLA